MPIGSRGWGRVVERPDPVPAKWGEIEDGAKKAFLISDARGNRDRREREFGPV